mmetsp:Transcript_37999/g.81186  ORF Transcript_37999/g.81186 Transcript_37999/m.81186 type:complete len:104 (+) Transcript_37999:584-895(+)
MGLRGGSEIGKDGTTKNSSFVLYFNEKGGARRYSYSSMQRQRGDIFDHVINRPQSSTIVRGAWDAADGLDGRIAGERHWYWTSTDQTSEGDVASVLMRSFVVG